MNIEDFYAIRKKNDQKLLKVCYGPNIDKPKDDLGDGPRSASEHDYLWDYTLEEGYGFLWATSNKTAAKKVLLQKDGIFGDNINYPIHKFHPLKLEVVKLKIGAIPLEKTQTGKIP